MLCPSCGQRNSVGKFCTSCGTPLGRDQRDTAVQPAASPGVAPIEIDQTSEPASSAPAIERSGHPKRTPEAFLELQPSESVVVHAASRIFAAHVAAGSVTDATQAELEERSVRAALRLAVITDRLVQSDDEEW